MNGIRTRNVVPAGVLMIVAIWSVAAHAATHDRVGHRLGRGVNLGNALEAPREGKWGVTLREEYFDVIKQAGFDSIRLPARWNAYAMDKAPYTIDADFFKRADWAVRNALDNGLAVVLNIHHYKKMFTEPAKQEKRFLSIWKQIAEHYAGYPPALHFEILNEPHGKLTSDLWNDLLVKTLAIIRESNPSRAIVIGTAGWGAHRGLKTLKVPEDDPNLIITVHYYLPFNFTHQGAGWTKNDMNKHLGTTWTGTAAQKKEVRDHFDSVAEWGRKHNRHIYLGEFGAYSKADMKSRVTWTSFISREAEKRGFSWAYWEFCAGFGIYDPDARKWRLDLLKALLPDTDVGSGIPNKR